MAYSKLAALFVQRLGMRFPMGQVEECWREAIDRQHYGAQFNELEIGMAQSFFPEAPEFDQHAQELIGQLKKELEKQNERIASLETYNRGYRIRVNAADQELEVLREDNGSLRQKLGLDVKEQP